MWVGPLIACLSLAVCLSALELGLRLAGWAWTLQRSGGAALSYRFSARENKDHINILALGDSFTFGGTSRSDHSYPSILERRLNARGAGPRVEVTNSGICESTSRHVRDALGDALFLNHPDVIVLLTGAANRFDPLPYTSEIESLSTGLQRWLLHLRVYKVLRTIFRRPPPPPSDIEVTFFNAGVAEEALALVERSRPELQALEFRLAASLRNPTAPGRGKTLVALGYILAKMGRMTEAEFVLRQAAAIRPMSDWVRVRLAFFYFRVAGQSTEDRAEKLRYCFEAGRVEPRFYQSAVFFQNLLKLYETQSVYDAAAVLREFQRATEEYPVLRRDPLMRLHQQLFQNHQAWEGMRDDWLRRDLEDIIARSSGKGVRLVLQTYPLPYSANRVLREVARGHGLPLVDNEPVFQALIAKNHGDRSPYIRNDDHCTDLGHEIMAKEVQKVLETYVFPDTAKLLRHGGWMPVILAKPDAAGR